MLSDAVDAELEPVERIQKVFDLRVEAVVARIDPETNDVVATIPTRARPDAIAVGEGLVWVTAY